MKKKILIISGGISKERKISLETGKEVAKELKKNGYNVKECEPNDDLIRIAKTFKPKILENLKIPYTHSGVIASAKAMNKEISKKIFNKNKILTPKYIKYTFDKSKLELNKLIEKKLNFPVVIKPINEGSSVNVFICNKNEIHKKLIKLKSYNQILIEEFIPGQEIQAAILGEKKLGAIELKPKRKFYDYTAKYNVKAKTEHIIPVNLNKKKYKELMKISFKVHNLIGCRGVSRSDFKFYKNKFYLLEINTQPGMTKLSLVPEISAYNGINFINLIKIILKDASTNK